MQGRFYPGLIQPAPFRQFQEGIWAAYTVIIYFVHGRLFFIYFILLFLVNYPPTQMHLIVAFQWKSDIHVCRKAFSFRNINLRIEILILGQFMSLVSLDPTWDSGQCYSSSPSSQALHRKETSAWWHTPAVF